MDTSVSIIVPIAPYHVYRAARALLSASRQTVPCRIIPVLDEAGRGPGWARNQGVAQADTPLVVFLDADDELLPTFVERALRLQRQTGRYVYSDYFDGDGTLRTAPDCAWTDGSFHLVTTLLPTAWARAVGGFDETLKANEDADFHIKLNSSGFCGARLPEALVIYHRDGQRSEAAKAERLAYQRLLDRRYRGKLMGCCGQTPPVPALARTYSTVKAQPTFLGKRQMIGPVSGVNYGRVDSTYTVDVDPRDVQARPDLWRVLPVPVVPAAAVQEVDDDAPLTLPELVAELQLAWTPKTRPTAAEPPPPAPVVATAPDVGRILRIARQSASGDPVFVFADKDYPSYTDVRRLVELSGFESLTMTEARRRGYPHRTSIILSPEQPRVEGISERAIWWTLEYGGEYEPDLSNWQGQVWASDPAWAKAHGAKLVVMGSHPDFADSAEADSRYDAVMLAYMTHRRQAVKDQLSDLRWPDVDYPGYGPERAAQLQNASVMLHAHQSDAYAAIAPQRFTLCAAYRLPLIHEAVPDAGPYRDYVLLAPYERLAAMTRSYLSGKYDVPTETYPGDRLYNWLCVEHTFRQSVMEALRS